jgi:hypothetical protein
LHATGTAGICRGPQPDIIDTPETLFGYVEIDCGGAVEVTNTTWIDDLDHLAEAAGRRLPFGAVGKLSSTMASAGYKRLLEDLHLLSETLLCKPAEFPDYPVGIQQKEKRPDAVKAPTAVTAADVIRSLSDISSYHSANLGSAQLGNLSLTGIMRILFSEEIHTGEIDPTAAEHRKTIEQGNHQEDEEQTPEDPRVPDPSESIPSAAQRKRLIQQLKQFVDRLSAPSFAQNCSARQLQQAAAYPLAVAQFAARGPWVSHDEYSQLGEIVGRACEVLFYRIPSAANVKGGDRPVRQSLAQEVRDRYAAEGRVHNFDQIFGDGTLWLVVMGSLAMLGANSETRFTRNLALRDVARFDVLSITAVPEHLVPLANRLWQGSAVDVADKISSVMGAFESLERYAKSCLIDCQKVAPSARVGDWLWNPNVGFSQITQLLSEPGKAMAHWRQRAEAVKVMLSYCVNLREASEHDKKLAALVAACSE